MHHGFHENVASAFDGSYLFKSSNRNCGHVENSISILYVQPRKRERDATLKGGKRCGIVYFFYYAFLVIK